ncbi:MAG TPA: DUF4234 domain-containing protein [Candidatus Saccharimonadales bacterium]|nr:DUF4234 domain-containing protein [Candidatus Saccharimonadales bacterium]
MKKRNPIAVVLLSIITFGIYDLYWLVDTKRVLNQKTKHHTPTIWLLIIPYVLVIAGYILLFTSTGMTTSTTTSTQPVFTGDSSSSSTSSSSSSGGEQVNTPGSRRPPQYLHICKAAGNIEYVSQGTPKCLEGDTYQSDYDPSVSGTLYSSPCVTTSGAKRYVYISTDEACPTGTKLLFYNRLDSTNQTTTTTYSNDTTQTSTDNVYGTSTSDNNTQLTHPAMFFIAMGLIFVGFITTFAASAFWFFRFSEAINEYTNGKMSTAVSFLILWLIHLIGVALIQDTFNNMEESPAATQPMAPQAAPTITPVAGSGSPAQAPAAAPENPGTPPQARPQSIYPEPTAPSMPGVASTPAPSAPSEQPPSYPAEPPAAPTPPEPPHPSESEPETKASASHFDSQAPSHAPEISKHPHAFEGFSSHENSTPENSSDSEESEPSEEHHAEVQRRHRPPLQPRDAEDDANDDDFKGL